MNYYQIEAFIKTIECGSMTKASEALFISRSTLSDRIMKLEEELDLKLFTRNHGSKGAQLTPKGLIFLDYANEYLSIMKKLNNFKENTTNRIEISISAPHSINSYLFSDFYTKYAKITDFKLKIQSHWNEKIYEMVNTYKLDIGIVSRPFDVKYVNTSALFCEPLVAIYNKKFSDYKNLKDINELSIKDEIHLDFGPDYENWKMKYLNTSDMPKITVDSIELLYPFLNIENAWAIVPLCAYNYLKRIDSNLETLSINPFYRTIYLLTHHNTKPHIDTLIKHLRIYLKYMQSKNLCKLIK